MTDLSHDPTAIIDDLAFRAGYLERAHIETIERLRALAARGGATADELRLAIAGLAIDTHKGLGALQVGAAARMAARHAATTPKVCAKILQFPAPAAEARPEALPS
ncbi:hypothetical protein [Bradyrhizobium sp. C9]|uniref:hypothetical protein n=1 Tax=Bradyrhizobium sp. C9 TaxID=142585 RepID=UPI000BEA658E|nr:hypothetical protein [Bradyrhizobium sp. C9]PDT77238.1 hypothetical protein CO675_11920 [Bradyrhizobium sp. C9]